MLKHCKIQTLLFIFITACIVNTAVGAYLPDVYQDEYVTVRSGVIETEHKPIHFGDALTLVVQVDFKSSEVLVEDLGEEFFRKNWGAEKGINLIGTPQITQASRPDGYSGTIASFSFQILDCPRELTSCSGHKPYEVPVFSLGYQIVDGSGDVQNNKSVRFRPWPGQVVLTQALHISPEVMEEFTTYFPGGAYPQALDVNEAESAGGWFILAGGLLFLAGFSNRLIGNNTTYRVESTGKSARRWEQVLTRLQDKSDVYTDEEWADHLRRCVTWYSLDELGINPCSFLHDDSVSIVTGRLNKEFRAYFFEVLNQESIAPGQRQDFISRFTAHAGIRPVVAA